jgi:hypothetical protein
LLWSGRGCRSVCWFSGGLVCRKLFAFWKEELISCIYANCVLISTTTCTIATYLCWIHSRRQSRRFRPKTSSNTSPCVVPMITCVLIILKQRTIKLCNVTVHLVRTSLAFKDVTFHFGEISGDVVCFERIVSWWTVLLWSRGL